jgi:uncharacterized membrane protein
MKSGKQSHDVKNSARGMRRFAETEAHHRLAIALVAAIITFAFTFRFARLPVSLILSWDAFALCSLVLAWLGMFFTDAKTRVREAHLQDSRYTIICGCVVLASVAGLAGAGMLLGSAKALAGVEATKHVVLAAVTVFSSWLLVHTMLALHYTHVFYCSCKEAGHGHGMGVSFPDEKEPDFLDFAYFSFVIGMTCQVSDVQVTSRHIRRIVLLHGMLSFAFNTIILALTINLASTLL